MDLTLQPFGSIWHKPRNQFFCPTIPQLSLLSSHRAAEVAFFGRFLRKSHGNMEAVSNPSKTPVNKLKPPVHLSLSLSHSLAFSFSLSLYWLSDLLVGSSSGNNWLTNPAHLLLICDPDRTTLPWRSPMAVASSLKPRLDIAGAGALGMRLAAIGLSGKGWSGWGMMAKRDWSKNYTYKPPKSDFSHPSPSTQLVAHHPAPRVSTAHLLQGAVASLRGLRNGRQGMPGQPERWEGCH